MSDLTTDVALEINGEVVSLYDVLSLAKLNGQLQFVRDAIDAEIVRQSAVERGIEVSDEELQQAADEFRVERDLTDAETTDAWLAEHRLSYTDWETVLEHQIITAKLRDVLTENRVDQTFAENRLAYDAVMISRILLNDEGIARELRAQVLEEGADFHALAREYSKDEQTRLAGGYAGSMSRSEMEAALEAALFAAQPGKIVGPLKCDEGWELIKVEAIKNQLFEEWLSERRRKSRIDVPLLEPICDEAGEEAVRQSLSG